MNTPSPLIPQGSLLEQKNKSRSRVKVAFFCVVGVHVAAILTALLAQGCKREAPPTGGETAQPAVPIAETNVPAFDPNVPTANVDTNVPTPIPVGGVTAPQPLTPGGSTPETVPGTSQEYLVQKGDSFFTIGKKFNVSSKAIQDANPTINPNRMQIGQKLVIPPPTASAAPGGAAAATPTGEQIYVVKAGDNLTKIAAQYGVTINALRRANNMSTDRIKVGDKLKIPAPAPR